MERSPSVGFLLARARHDAAGQPRRLEAGRISRRRRVSAPVEPCGAGSRFVESRHDGDARDQNRRSFSLGRSRTSTPRLSVMQLRTLARAAIACSLIADIATAQANSPTMAPVNSLPNPYKTIEGWAKMPSG